MKGEGMDKIGFAMELIGLGGLAEAYGNPKALSIALILIIVGGILIAIGDTKNDIKNYKRNRNSDSNVLDRLYFLR